MAASLCSCVSTVVCVVVVLVAVYGLKFYLPAYIKQLETDCTRVKDVVFTNSSGYISVESAKNNRYCYCHYHPCIPKCISRGKGFFTRPNDTNVVRNVNVSHFHPLRLPVHDVNTFEEINTTDFYFDIVHGDPCRERKFMIDEEYKILSDGRLYTPTKINNKLYNEVSEYCVESVDDELYVFMCFPIAEQTGSELNYVLYPIGMTISSVFLFITIFVYLTVHQLWNLHGKCLICHCSSLLVFYISLTVNQTGNVIGTETRWYCVVLAFIVQFSFLASFFWLNVMCFDIWWVFSGLRPLRGSVKEREHKKFIIYSAYAWGWALAIFAVTLTMQTVKSIPDTYVKPEFGVGKCWFRTDAATFWYFYFPIIILVVLNIIMFVTTAFRIRAHTRETEVLNRGESRRHDENEKQRYNLYLKLFIVMGVNWVMELVSWIVGGEKELWYVTDIANTLQGVLIFLIFVWKRRILRLLNNKLCPSLQLVPTTSSTRSKVSPSRTTSSSLKQTPSNNINTAPDSVSLKKMNSNV